MSKFDCSRQSELAALVRSGALDTDVQTHLSGCEACGEVARIARELAPLAGPTRDLPAFADLYWRAQARDILGSRNRRSWRAVAPLRYFHLAVGAALIVAALVFAVGPLIGPAIYPGIGFEVPLMSFIAIAAGGMILASGAGDLIYTSE